jgi:DNA polymerase-3 subunit chi
MTQVDFYVLTPDAKGDRFSLACRIAEKAWSAGHRVLIHVGSDAEAASLDRLLWTFKQSAFLPHGRLGACDPARNPILIGQGGAVGDEHQVLINLAAEIPANFSRFERIVECVDQDPATKQRCREHFAFYRDQGYPRETHEIA